MTQSSSLGAGRFPGCIRWMLTGLVLVVALQSALMAQIERETVRDVQRALVREGYDPGPVDGLIGPKTREATRRYQEANSLKVNGRLNAETLQALRVEGRGEKGNLIRKTGKGIAGGGKAVGKGGATAGKAVGKGATVTGKAVGKGGKETGKAVGKGATVTGKAVGKGGKETGKAAGKGGKETGKAVSKAAGATKRFFGGGGKDNELRKRVKGSLDENSRIDASKIDVKVDKGNVTLVFKEATRDEINRAVTATRKVKGVKEVSVRRPKDN